MKQVTASTHIRSCLTVIISLVLVTVCLPVPSSALPFYISGVVHAWGNGIGGVYRIFDGSGMETAYSDYAEISGPNGQLAISKYYANLATGQIGAYSFARSDYEFYARSAAAATTIEMQDTLRFYVPAGTYPDGLVATVYGSIGGFFSSVGEAEEYGRFQAIFGSSTYDLADYTEWGSYNATVNRQFVLTTTILTPSPNPRQALTVPKHIKLDLAAGRPLSVHALRNNDYGEATADFYDTFRVSSVGVPAGVTWDSESGVFLTQPSAVPEPATLALLGFGLLGLAGYARTKPSDHTRR